MNLSRRTGAWSRPVQVAGELMVLKAPALAILGPQILVGLGGIGGFHVGPVPVEAAIHAFSEVAEEADLSEMGGVIEVGDGGLIPVKLTDKN